MTERDVLVLGAGGAGLMCAAVAARRGRNVIALDHSEKLGRKILISGGGRCNFTNTGAAASSYHSGNPHFAKSALSRFRPEDFLALVRKHGVSWYEKKLGQLFCRDSAERIVDLLSDECRDAGAEIRLQHEITSVDKDGSRFLVQTNRGTYAGSSLVVATGGLSMPKIGATDLGYRVARKFGHTITPLEPALVQLTMDRVFLSTWKGISGLSVEAEVECRGKRWRENILFTHQGVSGPAILQASLEWHAGDPVFINLDPDRRMEERLLGAKESGLKMELKNVLAEVYPRSLAERIAVEFTEDREKSWNAVPINQIPNSVLHRLVQRLRRWELRPTGTGGWNRAEVTRGGVSTEELSSQTMESRKVKGLYFVGEVVDVTGMLGGYNFQWAWASGFAAGSVC